MKIKNFFQKIKDFFSVKVKKFWKFLKEQVFPVVKALIMAELKDFAIQAVKDLSFENLSNEEKRNAVFRKIQKYAQSKGMNVKDSVINLLIEIAVTAVKNETEKLNA